MKKIFFLMISFLLLLSLSAPSYAFSLRKVWNAIRELKALEQRYLPNLDAINTSTDKSAETLDEIKKSMTGNFGYGRLLNNPDDMNKRLWSNDKWIDVLAQTHAGSNTVFARAQETYAKLYPSIEPAQIRTTLKKNNLTRTHYEQTRHVSRAALAGSNVSYDNINDHIRKLHQLLVKLEDRPEEKAAIDFNARLVAELGFIQLEMLKQQAIQTQLIATQSQSDVNGLSDESQFLQWEPMK